MWFSKGLFHSLMMLHLGVSLQRGLGYQVGKKDTSYTDEAEDVEQRTENIASTLKINPS